MRHRRDSTPGRPGVGHQGGVRVLHGCERSLCADGFAARGNSVGGEHDEARAGRRGGHRPAAQHRCRVGARAAPLGARAARRDAAAARGDAPATGRRPPGPAAALGPAVEDTICELAEEIAELRSLIAELSPVALEELGLEAALESLAHHHRVENGLEVTVDLSSGGTPAARSGSSPSSRARSTARPRRRSRTSPHTPRRRASSCACGAPPAEVEVRVTDDGRGFEPDSPSGAGPDRARRAAIARRRQARGRLRAGHRDHAQRSRPGLSRAPAALSPGARRAARGAARSGPVPSACSSAASAGCGSGGTRPCAR